MAPWDIGLFLRGQRADNRLAQMLAAGLTPSTALDRLYAEAPECDPWRSASPRYFYQRNKYDCLVSLLPKARQFRRSLDIGCGTGLFTERLSGLSQEVIGIDLSATAIRRAGERFSGRGNLEFRQADLLDLAPTFEGSFDLVVIADVIYYLPPAVLTDAGLKALASRLARLLRPGAVLLVANLYFSGVDLGSRVSRRIHNAFRWSQAVDLTFERLRPFWLAGVFAPAGINALSPTAFGKSESTVASAFIAKGEQCRSDRATAMGSGRTHSAGGVNVGYPTPFRTSEFETEALPSSSGDGQTGADADNRRDMAAAERPA